MSVENLPIGVFDSGVGGLCVLKDLCDFFPFENFVYFGDNLNAPYGNKDIQTLKSLSKNIVERLISFGVKGIVIGCNTLSCNLYNFIKDCACVPVIKTLPPKCNDRRAVLLCTVKTSESVYVKNNFKGLVIPLKSLAKDIEANVFNLEGIDLSQIAMKIPLNASKIILGCTHYHFLKNRLQSLFPSIVVEDGYSEVKRLLYSKLKKQMLFKNSKKGSVTFIGECADFNEKIFKTLLGES